MTTLNQAERRMSVDQMRANFAHEGAYPDATDIELQGRYVAGTATLADLLAHAFKYAVKHAGPAARHLQPQARGFA